MKISVLVPAYHEENTAIEGLKSLVEALDFIREDYEVLVIVDGDPRTADVVKKFEHPKVKVLEYEKNRGKGFALTYGFERSTGDIVIFWDAGTQISSESLKVAWRLFSFSDADIVVGSKRHHLSKVDYPLKRRIFSLVTQIAAFVLFRFNVRDTQTGLKIYRREILEKIIPKIKTKGYAIDIEMLIAARSLGYKKIYESPVDLSHYKFGGAVNYKAVRQVALDMLKTYFRLLQGYYRNTDVKEPILYLTVDLEKDPWTNQIPEKETIKLLDLLKIKDKKITFFATGEIYQEKPDLLIRILAEGHELGLHGYSHKRLISQSDLIEELELAHDFITDLKPKGFRAPYVHLPKDSLVILKHFGFEYDSSIYSDKTPFMDKIKEIPVSAGRLFGKVQKNAVFPMNFTQALTDGLIPLGCGMLTAYFYKIQVDSIKRHKSTVMFIHPWQFTTHSVLDILLKNKTLELLPYYRNCFENVVKMTKAFKTAKLEELV